MMYSASSVSVDADYDDPWPDSLGYSEPTNIESTSDITANSSCSSPNGAEGGPAGAQSATTAPHRPCTQKACEGYRLDAVLHFTKRDMNTAYKVKQWLGMKVMLDRQGHRCSTRAELLCNMPGSSNEIQALKVAEKMTSTFIILRTPRYGDDPAAVRTGEAILTMSFHTPILRVMQMIVGGASGHRSVDNEGAFFSFTFDFQPDSASFQRHMSDKLSTCTDLHKRYRMLSERRPNSRSRKSKSESASQRNRNRSTSLYLSPCSKDEKQGGRRRDARGASAVYRNNETTDTDQDDAVYLNETKDVYQNDPHLKETSDDDSCYYNDSLNTSSDTGFLKSRPDLLPQIKETSAKQVQEVGLQHTGRPIRAGTIPNVRTGLSPQAEQNESAADRAMSADEKRKAWKASPSFKQQVNRGSLFSMISVSECSSIETERCGSLHRMNNELAVHQMNNPYSDKSMLNVASAGRKHSTPSIKSSPRVQRKEHIRQEYCLAIGRTHTPFNDSFIYGNRHMQSASSADSLDNDCEGARRGPMQAQRNHMEDDTSMSGASSSERLDYDDCDEVSPGPQRRRSAEGVLSDDNALPSLPSQDSNHSPSKEDGAQKESNSEAAQPSRSEGEKHSDETSIKRFPSEDVLEDGSEQTYILDVQREKGDNTSQDPRMYSELHIYENLNKVCLDDDLYTELRPGLPGHGPPIQGRGKPGKRKRGRLSFSRLRSNIFHLALCCTGRRSSRVMTDAVGAELPIQPKPQPALEILLEENLQLA